MAIKIHMGVAGWPFQVGLFWSGCQSSPFLFIIPLVILEIGHLPLDFLFKFRPYFVIHGVSFLGCYLGNQV